MAAQKKQITLLPKEEVTTLGRALTWALTAGRIIVVITELAVILAFLSRFWLDRTLTDLNEQIEQKVNLLRANQAFEGQFRRSQARLTAIREIWSQPDFANLTKTVLSRVPPEVKLDQVSVSRSDLQITGTSLSEEGVEIFIANLQEAKLGEVSLSQLGVDQQDVGIKFTISVKPKKS